MPMFVYDANSDVRQFSYRQGLMYDSESLARKFNYAKGMFHYLTIVLSNCMYNGSAFVENVDDLEAAIHDKFIYISNLDFRGVGCSMMHGSTDSLTLGISAGYYSDLANLNALEAMSLRVASNDAITNIEGLTVSEVRVESTLKQLLSF
jgi:hypothetical protein